MAMKWNKFILVILALSLAAFALTGCSDDKSTGLGAKKPQYVAKVNDSYITWASFDKMVATQLKFYETKARKLTTGEQNMLKNETVNNMVNQEIMAQEIKKRKITVSEKQVDDFIKDVKKGVGNDPVKWKDVLDDWNFTEESYKARVKDKLIQKALQESVTAGITDPLKKKSTFDKYILDLRNKAEVTIYAKF